MPGLTSWSWVMKASGFLLGLLVCLTTSVAAQAVEPRAWTFEMAGGDKIEGTVTLRGRLQNAGTNYFTDQRLVLTAQGQEPILVQAWLPSEAARPQTPTDATRKVMSDFLDKDVILTGHVETRPVKGVGVTKVFVVTAAQVAE